jgi:hypothetical protein
MRRRTRLAAALAVAAVLATTAQSCESPAPPEATDGTTTRGAWPVDSTTGPDVSGLDEESLPSCGHDGTWQISTPDTVVDGCRHQGRIRVMTTGVVLRNMVVDGTAVTVLVTNEGGGHLTIERSVVRSARAPDVPPCAASVGYNDWSATESEFTGCADGVKLGGTVVLDKSYIHGLSRYCEPGVPESPETCTHNDGLQYNDTAGVTGTIDVTITGSSVYQQACTSNRIIQAPSLVDSEFTIRRNFFYGSHGLINMGKAATDTNTGVIEQNLFAGYADHGPFSSNGVKASPGLFTGVGLAQVVRQENYFEDGTVVPASGLMNPYTCADTPHPSTTTTASTTTTTAP